MCNETQYDTSEDESDPVPSDLESEDDDEDYFSAEFSCTHSRDINGYVYSSLHQPL